MIRLTFILCLLLALSYLACENTVRMNNPEDGGGSGDTDTDTDSDTDTDTDSDTDSDTDTDNEVELSFIWIANSLDDTLSKIDTQTAVEVARYRTCPEAYCDPSRTSVNLHGDAVVTNRESFPSSVTKFAAAEDDCIDRNDNSVIDTSTGPGDILGWGEDECMIWHSELPTAGFDNEHGARATAWDGLTDPNTGEGGHVWVGTCCLFDMIGEQAVFKLDGDTGDILEQVDVPVGCAYGAAVDGDDGLWIYNFTFFNVVRLDMITLNTLSKSVDYGYGISVDSQGRVWTGGANGVSRYDHSADTVDVVTVPAAEFLRGIAVGVEKSAGYVWAADTNGTLIKIDEENVTFEGAFPVGVSEMIGVAVDYEGYVWTVSRDGNAVYKFDPEAETYITIPIGQGPYTYSDMTGVQLKQAVIIE